MAANSVAARLKETHPLYQQFQAEWQFYVDSYQGGDAYTGKDYLFKHARETADDYANRKARAVFVNFVRKQIDIYSSFIFKDPIVRETKDAEFREFDNNADRRGTPLSQIMSEQVGKFGMISGHTVTIVDIPKEAGASKTRLEDKRRGIRPYVTVYSPLETPDWALDSDGNYEWLRVCEQAPDIADPWAKRGKPKKRYRTWTKDEWMVHDEDGTEIERGTHGLGEVPAVFTPVKEHLQHVGIGESLLVDTGPLNRAIYNYLSLLDEFLYRQAFNILALPVDDTMTPEKLKALTQALGTQKGLFYPASGSPPSYVSPPSDPAEVIMQRIKDAHAELIEVAKLQDRKSQEKEKSGIAYKYEFHESNSAFAKIAKNLEDGEKKIIRLYYKWQGRDPEVSVSYPSDFNLTTLAEQIEESMSLLALNVSPTFTKQVKKNIVSASMPGLDEKTEETIKEEIDSAKPEDELEREVSRRLREEDVAA